jgi:hypothetical protein
MPWDRQLLAASLIGFERRRAALQERIAEVQSKMGDRVPAKTATGAAEAPRRGVPGVPAHAGHPAQAADGRTRDATRRGDK